MSRAHDYHIHQQLEPHADILRTGNAKRHTPTWVLKGRDAEADRERLGEEEYRRRCQEEQEREEDNQ
jgi:hypothetical protein